MTFAAPERNTGWTVLSKKEAKTTTFFFLSEKSILVCCNQFWNDKHKEYAHGYYSCFQKGKRIPSESCVQLSVVQQICWAVPCAGHRTRCRGRKNKAGPVPVLQEIMIMTNTWKQRATLCVVNKLEILFNTCIPSNSQPPLTPENSQARGTTSSRARCTESRLLSLHSESISWWCF